MNVGNLHEFTCNKIKLDKAPHAYGEMRSSNDLLEDPNLLKQRLTDDGYLLIKGFFDPEKIKETRQTLFESLSMAGMLDTNFPVENARLKPEFSENKIQPQIDIHPIVQNLIHNGKLKKFFSFLLGGPSQALNHIWVRTISSSMCTTVHCDHVYMSKGTKNLYTTWIPMGNVPRAHGSLMILENSHKSDKLKNYRSLDVDENDNGNKFRFKHGSIYRGMHYSRNAKKVQKELGLRWLTADFDAGDILIFSTSLLHATLDNTYDRLRLTIDARFQLISDPIDPRFDGSSPTLHAPQKPSMLKSVLRRLKY